MRFFKVTTHALLVLWLATATYELLASPMGTGFTYQGLLTSDGIPTQGIVDIKCALYDLSAGGIQSGPTITNQAVTVSNGLFMVRLDFGVNAFDGNSRWLEISVRGGTNNFQLLQPRHELTPTPMAVTAGSLVGVLPETQLPSSVPRLNNPQTYTGANTFLGATIAANPANYFMGSFNGVFYGNAAGLTNLDAVAILAATNSTWIATTNWVLSQGFQSTNDVTRKKIVSPGAVNGTNYILDFLAEVVEITATNDVAILQSTNRNPSGWYSESVWHIQGGPTNRTLRFNSSWVGLGTLATNSPMLIYSNKLTLVAFSVRGANETNVTYAIVRQE